MSLRNEPYALIGEAARVMLHGSEVLYEQPGHKLLKVSSGALGLRLGLFDSTEQKVTVLDGAQVVDVLRQALKR
jgi:hypothetical protein